MRTTRRQFLFVGAAGAAGLAGLSACTPTVPVPTPGCAPPDIGGFGPLPLPGTTGLVDEAVFQQRATDYLAYATQSLNPTSGASVTAHLVRASREPGFVWDPSVVTEALVNPDPYRDTLDFDLMNHQWLLRLGQGVLPTDTIAAIEDSIAGCRYRHDDPLPAGVIDEKWFWSENHRIIFAVDEYLGGMALPNRVFAFTGMTGSQHAVRAKQVILDWIGERATFGYSEWHSNTYMKYNYAPLLTLVEFADDEEMVSLAASAIDTCLFDLATHTHGGAYGVTHGRAYKGSTTNSLVESSFNSAKFLFDSTTHSYQGGADIGPSYLAGSTNYRLPEVIRRVGANTDVAVIRERHGVALDPHEEFSLDPQTTSGYDYDNPDNLPFWWSHGALTAWQLTPAMIAEAEQWRLFDTEGFERISIIRDFAELNPALIQIAMREIASFAAAGVLGESHTYTWRSPDAMLSSVIDHRFGDAMEQAHAWQATLDPEAVVFTNHPLNDLETSADWSSDNGYWTGTASMPRSAQIGRASIHVYKPAYASPTDELLGPDFGYEPFTHAFFPQDRFDEVIEQNGWVFGRKGDGYVALWSERPTQWRTYNAGEATGGHTLPFDLVADGGADNVWVCEVGRAADHGSFGTFIGACVSGTPVVTRTGQVISVAYASPTEGQLTFGSKAAFTVGGVQQALRDHPRHSSPWAEQCALGKGVDISDGGSRLELNFETGGRLVT